jgi:hypothetical protein
MSFLVQIVRFEVRLGVGPGDASPVERYRPAHVSKEAAAVHRTMLLQQLQEKTFAPMPAEGLTFYIEEVGGTLDIDPSAGIRGQGALGGDLPALPNPTALDRLRYAASMGLHIKVFGRKDDDSIFPLGAVPAKILARQMEGS